MPTQDSPEFDDELSDTEYDGPPPDAHFNDFSDLRNVDFSKLQHIKLDMLESSPQLKRWVALVVVALVAGILLLLPNTEYYQMHSQSSWLFFCVCGGAAVVGLTGGRILFEWAQEAAAEYRLRHPLPNRSEPEKPASPLVRGLVLALVLTMGGVVLFMLPHEAEWQGNGYSGTWFLTVAVAAITGLLAGRWLIMQASANVDKAREVKPIVLPPWLKWANLAALVIAGFIAAFGTSLFATSDPEALGFGLSFIGFIVGIGSAIWIARRFDEVEGELRARRVLERALGDDDEP